MNLEDLYFIFKKKNSSMKSFEKFKKIKILKLISEDISNINFDILNDFSQ